MRLRRFSGLTAFLAALLLTAHDVLAEIPSRVHCVFNALNACPRHSCDAVTFQRTPRGRFYTYMYCMLSRTHTQGA